MVLNGLMMKLRIKYIFTKETLYFGTEFFFVKYQNLFDQKTGKNNCSDYFFTISKFSLQLIYRITSQKLTLKN